MAGKKRSNTHDDIVCGLSRECSLEMAWYVKHDIGRGSAEVKNDRN